MMRTLIQPFIGTFLIASIAISIGCNTPQKSKMTVVYPETKQIPVKDTFFGTEIVDPYRWLEDDRSAETEAWVKEQNEVTFNYLNQIPFRAKIEKRLSELWNYEKVSAPFKEGKYTYFYKNDGLQNQYVVYRKDEDGNESVFLDPNQFSEDGTTSLGQMSFSKDGSIVAYSISEGGSDWRKIIVMDVESGKILEDTLVDIKFSGISWYGNEGFYYSSYEKPDGSELSAKTDHHKLYYHQLGTPQSSDPVVFGNEAGQKRRYVGGRVTEDDRFLVISGAVSTSGNDLYVKDLSDPEKELITVIDNFDSDVYVLDNQEETFFLVTNLDAPNKRVVKANLEDLSPSAWVDVIPEKEEVLSPSTGGGYIFAEYMKDAVSSISMYEYDGTLIQEIKLPGVGSAGGFNGKKEDSILYYSFTNYSTPASIYSFQVDERTSSEYWSPEIDFSPAEYESKQVFYKSKDGTEVPMIITYKKGLELNGKNPTILYGYGGFNISLTPSFSPVNAVWMEMGGIYAVANLRGGGEYGKKWHQAGTKLQKQNVFDDFIAAAEYLIDGGYTSNDHLSIRGGSNGGLLVGAVMTQRPDLVQVALPAVGVLDMLRYHTFTAGAGWAYDYGTAEDNEEMFKYLLGYSPVHNVKEGTSYPATLITTGDHDDRVVPAHSFKFAAELQKKHNGEAPVLIRIETNAGHGAGTPVSKTIQQYADIFSFTLYNMNVTPNLPE
jgi:prolyl oligopeptidase